MQLCSYCTCSLTFNLDLFYTEHKFLDFHNATPFFIIPAEFSACNLENWNTQRSHWQYFWFSLHEFSPSSLPFLCPFNKSECKLKTPWRIFHQKACTKLLIQSGYHLFIHPTNIDWLIMISWLGAPIQAHTVIWYENRIPTWLIFKLKDLIVNKRQIDKGFYYEVCYI